MKIKGAIFDCDGTLIDSLGFWNIFYQKIGEQFFGNSSFSVAPADDRAMRTQNVYFLSKLMHEKYGVAESADAVCEWCIDLFTWYYTEVVELKPGVKEFLAYLQGKGVKMCIASAAEINLIRLVLGRHNVLHYFEDIISCSDVGAGKDKPDVFIAAERFMGTPREQTWVFEDSMLAIQTAKTAGFPIVGVYDPLGFGQERARALSEEYINEGESFSKLIAKID